MIERRGDWAEVVPTMYVRDRNEKVWRVDDERDGQLLLARPNDERTVIHRPTGAVAILEMTEEEVLALLQRELGGTVFAVREPGKPISCPPLPHQLSLVHTHFFLMHGIWTGSGPGSRAMSKLLEAHKDDHLNPDTRSHAWVNHEHH